jgi:hypothetical protein
MRLLLISCDVFYREMCLAAARSPHKVDLKFLPKGLHDIGCAGMRQRLQETIDGANVAEYDALALGYGLCNNGIHNLRAPAIPLVIPRAHDCMTLFFGSRQRYLDYFNANPGTYFQTSGWLERAEVKGELRQVSIGHLSGMDQSYPELVQKYGEDNAQYLWESLCNTMRNYTQCTYIAMGVGPDAQFEAQAKQEALEHGWSFVSVAGSLNLIQRLANGDWDAADFLVVPPGGRVTAVYDEGIIALEPPPSAS